MAKAQKDSKKSKGDLSRQKILDHALVEFGKHGFEQTSFQTVAGKAGFPKTAITHYFKNKIGLMEACFDEVFRYHAEMMARTSDMNDNAYVRLQKSFMGNLQLYREKPEYVHILIALYSLSAHDKSLNRFYTEVVSKIRARYQEILLAGVRENLFKLDQDASVLAEMIHELIIGSVINYATLSHVKDSEKFLKKKWKILIQKLTNVSTKQPSLL